MYPLTARLAPAIAEIHERLAKQAAKQFTKPHPQLIIPTDDAQQDENFTPNCQSLTKVSALVRQLTLAETPSHAVKAMKATAHTSANMPATPRVTEAAVLAHAEEITVVDAASASPAVSFIEEAGVPVDAADEEPQPQDKQEEEITQQIQAFEQEVEFVAVPELVEPSTPVASSSPIEAGAEAVEAAAIEEPTQEATQEPVKEAISVDICADSDCSPSTSSTTPHSSNSLKCDDGDLDETDAFDTELDETDIEEQWEGQMQPNSPTPFMDRHDCDNEHDREPSVSLAAPAFHAEDADAAPIVRAVIDNLLDRVAAEALAHEQVRLAFYPCLELVTSEAKLASSLEHFDSFWLHEGLPAIERQSGLSKAELQAIIPRQIATIVRLHQHISHSLIACHPFISCQYHHTLADPHGALRVDASGGLSAALLAGVVAALCKCMRSFFSEFLIYNQYQYEAKECCDAEAKLQSHQKKYRLAILSHMACDNGKNLSHYISQPWQRLSRYEMLFKGIREKLCLIPEAASVLIDLDGVIDELVKLNQKINIQGIMFDLKHRIKDLAFSLVDDQRELLREDAVKQIKPKEKKLLMLTFNDGVLLLSQSLKAKGWIKIDDIHATHEGELVRMAISQGAHSDSAEASAVRRSLKRFSFKSASHAVPLLYELRFASPAPAASWAATLKQQQDKNKHKTPTKATQTKIFNTPSASSTPSKSPLPAGPPLLSSLRSQPAPSPAANAKRAPGQFAGPSLRSLGAPKTTVPGLMSKGVQLFPSKPHGLNEEFAADPHGPLISLGQYFDQVRRASISSSRLSLSMNAVSRGVAIDDREAAAEFNDFECQLDGMIDLELEIRFESLCQRANSQRLKSMRNFNRLNKMK